jgi:hypothetical protein
MDGITAGLIDQISMKTEELRRTGEEISETIARIAELADGIKRDILAIDTANRDLSRNKAVLDHRTLVYVKEMEQRTKARLRYYHYLVAKAFEYRLLKPYQGDLDVERIIERMIEIAQAGHQGKEFLNQQEFDLLRGVYDDILCEIVRSVVDYLGQNPRSALLKTYVLSQPEIDQLNTNLYVRINLMEKGVLDTTREDHRLAAVDLTTMGVEDYYHVLNSSMTVEAVHSGASKLRKGVLDLAFFSTNYIRWAATYEANDGLIHPEYPSPLAGSLLCFLLQRLNKDCSTNLVLFSTPGAWADIYLAKYTSSHIQPSDVVVTSLTVRCTVDSGPLAPSLATMEVFASTDEIRPLFLLDRADLRGRRHGIGRIYRTFSADTEVQVTAPPVYGSWRFAKWTWGRTNTFAGPTLQIGVPRSGLSLRAVYVNSDTDEDGLPDWFELWATHTLDFGPMDDPNRDGRTLLDDYLSLERPVIADPLASQDGPFGFVVYGDPAYSHVVEASADFSTWTEITNISAVADTATVVLGQENPTVIQHRPPPGTKHLFYRVRTNTGSP